MSKLAINGGSKIRETPWPKWPIIGEEEIDAVTEVLRSGRPLSAFTASPGHGFLGGEKVREFESAFAKYNGMKYAVAVNSATSGLHCALVASGVKNGSEVITTSYSFTSSASCILMAGGTARFADVDPLTYNITPESFEASITKKTRAAIVVHLLGQPAEIEEICKIAREHDISIVEDVAQSPGARFNRKLAGTFGDCSVFSFNEPKNLSTGEGSIILTNDDKIAEICRLVRNHGEAVVAGEKRSYLSTLLGYNYRMTELHAAIGIEQLKKFDELTERRIKLSKYLCKLIENIDGVKPPFVSKNVKHVFHVFGMTIDNKITSKVLRQKIIDAVNAEGVPVSGGYPHPLYENPIFKETGIYSKNMCPVAEELCYKRALWTAVNRPPATNTDMNDIAAAVEKVMNNIDQLK